MATTRAAQALVVTIVDDDDMVIAALAAGARGYVLKGASADEITAAVGPSPRAALCSARA